LFRIDALVKLMSEKSK